MCPLTSTVIADTVAVDKPGITAARRASRKRLSSLATQHDRQSSLSSRRMVVDRVSHTTQLGVFPGIPLLSQGD